MEWRTFGLMLACYAMLFLATTWLAGLSLFLAFLVAVLGITLHSSLQHEALHGHPTRNALINEALVFLPVGLLIPYRRFRDLHIIHHNNDILTDPYDDPESNFLDPAVWNGLPRWKQVGLSFNNTLFGRILIGPSISVFLLVKADIRAIRKGEKGVLGAWLLHAAGLIPVFWWLGSVAEMPFWTYALAAYAGMGILKIRTYLEHRASENAAGRTVIIEDRGILAFLFLNNNYHVVHHTHPGVAWYRLQDLYYANAAHYQALNDGYVFRNYWEIFRLYLFNAKDPVAHPLR